MDVITQPLTTEQIAARQDKHGYFEAVVAQSLYDLIWKDGDTYFNNLQEKVVARPHSLQDMEVTCVGAQNGLALIKLRACLEDEEGNPVILSEMPGFVPLPYHTGDEVTWNDPDEGACSRTGRLLEIERIGEDSARITWEDGTSVEVLIRELS